MSADERERESGSTLACGRAMANGFSSFKSAPLSPADGSGGGVADGFRLCGSCRKEKRFFLLRLKLLPDVSLMSIFFVFFDAKTSKEF